MKASVRKAMSHDRNLPPPFVNRISACIATAVRAESALRVAKAGLAAFVASMGLRGLRGSTGSAALAALMVLGGSTLVPAPAAAVESPVDFGTPAVLSLQGQRLKVMVPVKSPSGDRVTATSFLVRETEVPLGYQALSAQDFTVMRPADADYVVFHSREAVDSPQVSLLVSVAGDPRGPYRIELQVPPAEFSPR